MRVDVITLQAVQNYGSVLQALATQEVLKQHGCDVVIINYQRENVRDENVLKTWAKGSLLKKIVMFPTVLRWKKVFGNFQKVNLNLTSKIYTTEKDFESYPLEADAYCTGSDQVWNSKWNRGIIPPLYLSFVPEDKFKFSFSASFGQSELEQNEIDATKKYIEQYKFISVRESSAVDIVEKQYGYPKATHLVDPTLSVTPAFWRGYASSRKINEKYMLVYNLNRSKAFDDYAVKLAKKANLRLVRFCTRYDQFYRPGKSMLVPEVADFISLIDNAELVLTDSFHASAFSLNLNTEPICVYPAEFGGRLQSLLEMTESEQRHVTSFDDFDILDRHVNFDNVNSILDNERRKVDDYLTTVLDSVENS